MYIIFEALYPRWQDVTMFAGMTSSALRELYFAILDKALAAFDLRLTER